MATLWELLAGASYVADTPGAYARGLIAGRPGERVSGRDMLQELGMIDDPDSMGGSIAGLGAEVLLDPLNWAGGGGIALMRKAAMRESAEQAAKRIAMSEDELAAMVRLSADRPIPPDMLDEFIPPMRAAEAMPSVPPTGMMDELMPAGPAQATAIPDVSQMPMDMLPPQMGMPPGLMPQMQPEMSPMMPAMSQFDELGQMPVNGPQMAPESLPMAPGVPSPIPEMNALAGQEVPLQQALQEQIPAAMPNPTQALSPKDEAAALAASLPEGLRPRPNQPPGTIMDAMEPAAPAAGRFAGKSEDELRDMLTMFEDNIRLKRSKGETVPPAWVDGASEIRAILGGDDPGKFIYADEGVYGNPLFAGNRPGHENLIPIKLDASTDLSWRIEAAQKRINEIQAQIGKANAAVKAAKTPAARKKAEAAMSNANFTDLKIELDDLNQTHRYLGKLQDQQRAKFGSAAAPPPTVESALTPAMPVEPTTAPPPALAATLDDYQNAITRYRNAGSWDDVSTWVERATKPRGGLKVAELKTLAESLGVQVQGKRTDIVAQLEGWVRAKGKVPQVASAKAAVSDPVDAVRQTIQKLSGGDKGKRIRLAELRSSLSSVERQQLDKALLEMEKRGEIIAYPLDDPLDIKAADEAAALKNSAGFPRHILYMGDTPGAKVSKATSEKSTRPIPSRDILEEDANEFIKGDLGSRHPHKTAQEAWEKFRRTMSWDLSHGEEYILDEATFKQNWETFAYAHGKGGTTPVARNSDDAMLEELMREQADEMAAEEAAAAIPRGAKKKDAPVVDKPPEIQQVAELPQDVPSAKLVQGEVEFGKETTTGGRKEFRVMLKTVDPNTGMDQYAHRLEVRQIGRGSDDWEVVNSYYDGTSGNRNEVILASGIRKADAKQVAQEYLSRVEDVSPGGKLAFAKTEAELATDPAKARALRLRQIEPQSVSIKDGWAGNASGDYRLLSDGRMIVDGDAIDAAASKAMKKNERVQYAGNETAQRKVRDSLDEYWKILEDSTKTQPATVLGREIEYGRVYAAAGKKVYGFDSTRFSYLQRITGADSYRIAKLDKSAAIVFDKDGKPVASLLPIVLDNDESAIDIPTALKRAASWQTPAKGKKR